MIEKVLGSAVAIVGGGRACKTFLELLMQEVFTGRRPQVLGVADINPDADGMRYARTLGISTSTAYTDLYRLEGLQTLLELTNSNSIIQTLRDTLPAGVTLIDHFEARAIRDMLMVERARIEAARDLERVQRDPAALPAFLSAVMDRFAAIIERRNRRSREIEIELVGKERTLYEIIQGSTIPTFVIDRDHIITHWNKALEKLTGVPAGQMIGTNRQWHPFYTSPRPSMADVVLSRSAPESIEGLYGNRWRPSALIDGAFEAEGFFPHLGENGKWCWFTAAPIRSTDGRVVGAIETLWDKTEDKRAEQDRERHTAELSAMVSIYSALNAPGTIEARIRPVMAELQRLTAGDGICLFLRRSDGNYHLVYGCGSSENACRILPVAGPGSAVHHAGEQRRLTRFDELPPGCTDEIRLAEDERLETIVYLPVGAEGGQTFGVIRISGRSPARFPERLARVLELIGSRIAAAFENAVLQEQLQASEEKYRSVFNNDPNPIFVVSPHTFQILDANERAESVYGYPRAELVRLPFFVLGDESDPEVRDGLQGLEKGRHVLFSKKRHYQKGRRVFHVNMSVSRGEYGGRDVLIATTTDITGIMEREAQLVQAGKMTTLGVMAAGMAHEINQPLNVIQLSADYLLKLIERGRSIDDAELQRVAEDIIRSVERASSVITHVRAFSRQADFARTRIDLNAPVRDVFKILGHQLKAHQIEVELDLSDGLPPVLADHNRLEQVFVNLVSNAIDAIEEKCEGAGRCAAADRRIAIRSRGEDGRVTVEVSDTGIGMPEHVKSKLFEPFFTTKKVGKGTGLGTSISYGIVREYGGTIDIRSAPGCGTTFRLSFPAATEGSEPS